MEFLKNHYEKFILGLTLLLMAAGAVMLVLEAGMVQEELDGYRKTIVESEGKPPATEDSTARRKLLDQARRPPQTDFVKVHRVFNPDAWYVDTNGNLVAGTNVGVNRLAVQSITPQQLQLEFAAVGGSQDRPSVSFNMVRQFGRTPAETNRTRRSIYLNTTNISNTLDPARKLVLLAREIGGTPEAPEVKLELHEPGKDPLKFPLSKAQNFATVIDYVAHIYYEVETNFVWKVARKDTPLTFAGDTNIVVEVTATNVVVRAVSNDKITILPLGPAQPAALRPKAP
jgi:hypothetical protein